MKFSLFVNDKSTYWDEVLLGIFILICLAIGVSLIAFKPSFWIISSTLTASLGVVAVLLAVMFIPSLIYRLKTNDKK